MPFTLTMPKLSPTMEGGTIVKWHKQEGDQVNEGDVLFEVATDKATVEYNAIDKGFLRKILVQEGEEALLNQPVAIFTETKEESIEGYEPEGEAAAAEEVKEMTQEEGEEKPKEKKKKAEPEAVKKGLSAPGFTPEPPLEEYEFEWREKPSERILASPLAKQLASERNIDLSAIKGSGPGGRVMSRDLDLSIPKAAVSFGPQKLPDIPPGTYEEEPLGPMRKAIGERLQASKTFIPHFYVQQEVDADPLMAVRNQLKAFDLKVTFNDFVIRAAALALREHPEINSGFNSEKNQIIRFKTIDISIAVSIEAGLITPIIRHADYKNVGELSGEVKYLAGLAKKGKLAPEQYRGGSFTISNLGMFGIRDFQAVINPPQAAILAVGGIQDRLVLKNGQAAPGKILQLSLSSDHRVIDGADAAQFLNTVKKYLENPAVLLV
ncbi:MAG: pyruvate dehydrogenase complex dihydrolipoamide acetyltransferase [Simkaniaceae bacterium]